MNLERKNERQHGGTLVEAALSMLVFFVFLFAIMEFGRILNVSETLTNAAREGARLAVTPLTQTSIMPTDDEIRTEVRRFLRGAHINDATATITITRPTFNTGDGSLPPNAVDTEFTRVRVSVPYQFITLSMFSSGGAITLTGTALMRDETSP